MQTPSLQKSIRIVIAATLVFNCVFLVKDLMDDVQENAGLGHIIPEVVIVIGTVLTAVLALILYMRQREKVEGLSHRVLELEKQSSEWQNRTKIYAEGLSHEIDLQMTKWQLSPSEKEITLLMLKGLSNKEISEVRETSEQTIKQQSSAIYRKSGLSNRAELSAFFLEDLLFPNSESVSSGPTQNLSHRPLMDSNP